MNCVVYQNSYILTKNGYYYIDDLDISKEIEICPPPPPIKSKIKKNTSKFQIETFYKILLSDGCELLCSDLQSLNIVDDMYSNSYEKINIDNIKKDNLIYTYNFPIINELENIDLNNILYPYTHGYYCGCINKIDGVDDTLKFESNLIYINLIGDKKKLKSKIEITGKYSINKNKITGLLKVDIDKKLTVPINGNIKNKLLWLSGLIDNNGFITKLQDAKFLNIIVLSKKFAMDIKFLFNTLGINPHIRLDKNIRKFKLSSGEINEVIKYYWLISLDSEETNMIFMKSNFNLMTYYLEYDKSIPSIDQDIARYLTIKKINKVQLKKESFIIQNTNSCIVNGVLIHI